MKRFLKFASVFLAAFLIFVSAMCGCQLSFEDETEQESEAAAESEGMTENLSTRKAKVSIIQFMDYSSLNECCEGVKKSLDEANVEYEVTVGSENSAESDCEEAAQNIAINGGYDLIVTIGTPASVAVYSSISTSSKIPVVFCAVTDPVGAKLVESEQTPVNKCTGVSAQFDIKEQLNMINTFQPYITKLGVIYTKDEQNTEEQLKILKEEAEKLDIEIFDTAVSDPSELSGAADDLLSEVDAITLLPDNMVAANSWNIVNRGIVAEKPIYGVNLSQVREGCLAGYCFDFEEMGKEAGKTAAAVLRGQSAADTPVLKISDSTLYVNSDILEKLEMEIPEKYSSAEKVKTSYETN